MTDFTQEYAEHAQKYMMSHAADYAKDAKDPRYRDIAETMSEISGYYELAQYAIWSMVRGDALLSARAERDALRREIAAMTKGAYHAGEI